MKSQAVIPFPYKQCARCRKFKSFDDFSGDKRCKDGHKAVCKQCFSGHLNLSCPKIGWEISEEAKERFPFLRSLICYANEIVKGGGMTNIWLVGLMIMYACELAGVNSSSPLVKVFTKAVEANMEIRRHETKLMESMIHAYLSELKLAESILKPAPEREGT